LVSHKSVAPGTILRGSQLIHLGDALLEFLVLALLVAVSLILAFPRKVVLLLSATVQWDQEVCTGVSVRKRKTGIGHFLTGSDYLNELAAIADIHPSASDSTIRVPMAPKHTSAIPEPSGALH
jgi:hypothetical protein